jgi:hypothetical protein
LVAELLELMPLYHGLANSGAAFTVLLPVCNSDVVTGDTPKVLQGLIPYGNTVLFIVRSMS